MTYDYARNSKTVSSAVSPSLCTCFLSHKVQASTAYLNEALKGVGKDYNQEMLRKLPVSLRWGVTFIR